MENLNSENFVKTGLQPLLEAALRALDEIKKCAAEVEDRRGGLMKEIEDSRDLLRNASSSIRHQNEVTLNECNQRFDKFLKNSEDNLNVHEAKLTELIGKATVGPISSRYDAKARSERTVGRWFLGAFYFLLLLLFLGGGCIVYYSWGQLPKDMEFWKSIKIVLMRFIVCVPIYVPLFWLAAHFNRWAAQKNRLAEEYEHKKLVVETYVGLADQVDALVGKGVKAVPDLIAKQLERTIGAVCFDACSLLDKVQIQTPVGEISKGACQVMSSVMGAMKGDLK